LEQIRDAYGIPNDPLPDPRRPSNYRLAIGVEVYKAMLRAYDKGIKRKQPKESEI